MKASFRCFLTLILFRVVSSLDIQSNLNESISNIIVLPNYVLSKAINEATNIMEATLSDEINAAKKCHRLPPEMATKLLGQMTDISSKIRCVIKQVIELPVNRSIGRMCKQINCTLIWAENRLDLFRKCANICQMSAVVMDKVMQDIRRCFCNADYDLVDSLESATYTLTKLPIFAQGISQALRQCAAAACRLPLANCLENVVSDRWKTFEEISWRLMNAGSGSAHSIVRKGIDIVQCMTEQVNKAAKTISEDDKGIRDCIAQSCDNPI